MEPEGGATGAVGTAGADRDLDEAIGRGAWPEVVAHLAAELRARTTAGDARGAAMAAARLGDVYANVFGNQTAARAWFARADRLIADEPPCPEQGWVALAAMGCEVDDPSELRDRADRALDIARRFGDVNLETKALADGGLARVQAGQLAEGFAMLDEAMALACAASDDLDSAAKSVCSFFTACYHAADFARAGTWTPVLEARGMIGPEPPQPIYLSSHCDSVQAALLCCMGRWGDAEALLERAIAEFELAMGAPAWHPAIELADLRIRQRRLADAEVLLLGKDAAIQALLPTARLHLARGEAELAEAMARRGLRAIAQDRVRAVDLLSVVAHARLALGDPAGAERAVAEIHERLTGLDLPLLRARAASVEAAVLAAGGRHGEAATALHAALDGLQGIDAPWCRAVLHLDLARVLEASRDQVSAVVEARAAQDLLSQLDVVIPVEDEQLLARLTSETTARARASAPVEAVARLRLTAGRWFAEHAGTTVPLRDSKGLHYLAAVLAAPGREHHVLDLVDRVEGLAPGPGPDRRQLGDAGPLSDATARQQYRTRVEALRVQIDDALAGGDEDGALALQEELDGLVAHLAQAYGLGGRARLAGSAAERARLNVTRAVRTAVRRIEEALPLAGAALDRTLRTGTYCTYAPEPGDVRWEVFTRT